MRGAWMLVGVHLVWQLVVCFFFGGSWLFVVLALVLVFVLSVYFVWPRLVFRILPELCAAPWACSTCAPVLAELRRS